MFIVTWNFLFINLELALRCVFVVMKDLTCLVILVIYVGHLTAEYFLLETEDEDNSKSGVPLAGFPDGSGVEADESLEAGSDYADPPPPSTKPTTIDYLWYLRYHK